MGLDQYLFKTKASKEEVENKEVQADEIEIAYWRKHPNLQGYMQNLWKSRTGKENAMFNCINVYLTLEDLEDWENTVKQKEYPETTGFFFGSNSDEYYLEHDLESIQKAKKALEEGYTVYYTSWW